MADAFQNCYTNAYKQLSPTDLKVYFWSLHCSEHATLKKKPPSLSAAYLPELLQLVYLLGGDLTGPELLLLRWDLHQPGQKAAVLDQWLPLRAVPVDVLQATLAGTGLPAWRYKV